MELDLLQPETLLIAYGTAFLLGALSPLVGMLLVMRRFSLLADTLAHVSLLGVAVSSWLVLPVTWGALLGAVVGGIGIELLRRSRRVLSEATLAIFLAGSLALAITFFALQQVDAEEIEAYLFGNLASVTGGDLAMLLGIAVVLVPFMLAFLRQLFLVALDEDLARVNGIAVRRLNLVFMLLASTVVAVGIKVVGVLLVSSLVVLPVMAALQWRTGFKKTLFLSLLLSELSVAAGFFFAFLFALPSGAAIALAALFLFCVSYVLQYRKK